MHVKQLSHCLVYKEVPKNSSIIILVPNSSCTRLHTETLTPSQGKIKEEILFMQKPH